MLEQWDREARLFSQSVAPSENRNKNIMSDPVIGVIGTGDFASYLIAALRNGGYAGRIVLSPHSREKAERLRRERGCEIAADNSDLLAKADWMLIAIRPEQLDKTMAGLAFRPSQTVLSAVAGVTVDDLRNRLPDVSDIVRIMPSSYIETMPDGLIPMFPPVDEVRQVLSHAGTVMAFETEEQFDLATVAACMSGWLYRAAGALAEWFEGKGMSQEDARLLSTGNIMGAMAHARATPQTSLEDISDGIATDGTYTKIGLDSLRDKNFMEPWQRALDEVFAKLNGNA